MERLNKLKKYIIPLLFSIAIIIFLPKQSFYKKETITLKIEATEDIKNGLLYMEPPFGYKIGSFTRKLNGKNIEEKIKNLTYNNYQIWLKDYKGTIKEISLISKNNKKIILEKNTQKIWYKFGFDQYYKIYNISMIAIIVIISICFISFRIKINKNKIILLITSLLFLSIAVNLKYYNKILGIFLSLTFFEIFKNKERKYGFLEIGIFIVFILGFFSEYFAYKNYDTYFEFFQNSLLLVLSMKIWNFNKEEKESLKKFLKIALILMITVSIVSPFILAGVYCFTYGILSMVLFVLCFEELFYKRENRYEVVLNILFLGLSIIGVILSSRRTLVVVLAVWLVYYLIKGIGKKVIIGCVIFLILGGVGIKLFYNNQYERTKEFVLSIKDIKTNDSNLQRILMWRRSYYIFKNNPILGIGTNSFYVESQKKEYEKIKDKRESFQDTFKHPHNEYLQQLTTRGIIGFIIYAAIFIGLIKRILFKKEYIFEESLVIIYSIFGMFDPYTLRRESVILFAFLGIDYFISSVQEKDLLRGYGNCLISIPFIIGLYFNKRYRYYFLIVLIVMIIKYFYDKRKEKYEKV